MYEKKPVINEKYVMDYIGYLREQERSKATLQKYQHDLNSLIAFLDGRKLTKTELINWKECLTNQYAPSSVNAINVKENVWRNLCVLFFSLCHLSSWRKNCEIL